MRSGTLGRDARGSGRRAAAGAAALLAAGAVLAGWTAGGWGSAAEKAPGRPAGTVAAGVLPDREDGPEAGSPEAEARRLLEMAGVRGGLVVHLGCGDGRLTAALRASDAYLVHGLETDAARVAEARRYVRERGLYGPVSVERLQGTRLPYVDGLVNLVVVDRRGEVPESEVMRVLAPGGVVCERGADGRWSRRVKPRPADIDEWTHFLHDASGNAVARDRRVGPPRSFRWGAGPLWLRSHETPSGLEAMVVGGGRLFYILDEGLIGITDPRLPERWALVCRDAHNGKLLWRRPLKAWGWRAWARGRFEGKDWTALRAARVVVPDEAQRRLVVAGDRLYATLAYRAPLSVLDAATGEVVATVPETAPVREVLAVPGSGGGGGGGAVVVHSGEPARLDGSKPGDPDRPETLWALDGRSARVRWRRRVARVRPLMLAADAERVVCQTDAELVCLGLADGKERWRVSPKEKRGLTLVLAEGVVLLRGAGAVEARDAETGKALWHQKVPPVAGAARVDLFVADGVVWPGVSAFDEAGQPRAWSPHALAVGYDLKTGREVRRIRVRNFRSPEHHHRCYRNKATLRYIMTGAEGVEFLDLAGDGHSQDNFVRGSCRMGVVPAEGLLYVPPDQCFCEPGAKLLGLVALAAATPAAAAPAERLERGPAYAWAAEKGGGGGRETVPSAADWPTFRHDPARHGTTPARVPAEVAPAWQVDLGGRLTQPVVADGRVFVAQVDAHTVHCLDAATGRRRWAFTAGGRVDSPPTVWRGRVLFGSADGRVYCLRAEDGALAWRLLAAPADCRGLFEDRVESLWPVHGSVLVTGGVAYAAAGRSSYLDGGVRLLAFDPATGRVLHRAVVSGPWPDRKRWRDVSFYLRGANSDVLAAEGGRIYMRQKVFTPDLREVEPKILSSKGEADVGLHVFSTAGLLDDSWYNRTFWMYAKRWPGFQLANQAPKAGQLLVVDEERTWAVKVFYRRNVHSPMFFPGREGYLVFADRNTTEPQIVGEPGARPPLRWLPQSDYSRGRGGAMVKLDAPAFGRDKGIGYTRAEPPLWTRWLAVRVRAMVKAGDVLFCAGPPDVFDPKDPYGPFEGRKGGRLVALSAEDGRVLAETALDAPPVFDGLIAAGGRLYLADRAGRLRCFAGE